MTDNSQAKCWVCGRTEADHVDSDYGSDGCCLRHDLLPDLVLVDDYLTLDPIDDLTLDVLGWADDQDDAN